MSWCEDEDECDADEVKVEPQCRGRVRQCKLCDTPMGEDDTGARTWLWCGHAPVLHDSCLAEHTLDCLQTSTQKHFRCPVCGCESNIGDEDFDVCWQADNACEFIRVALTDWAIRCALSAYPLHTTACVALENTMLSYGDNTLVLTLLKHREEWAKEQSGATCHKDAARFLQVVVHDGTSQRFRARSRTVLDTYTGKTYLAMVAPRASSHVTIP